MMDRARGVKLPLPLLPLPLPSCSFHVYFVVRHFLPQNAHKLISPDVLDRVSSLLVIMLVSTKLNFSLYYGKMRSASLNSTPVLDIIFLLPASSR
jgi:hypothetical protein